MAPTTRSSAKARSSVAIKAAKDVDVMDMLRFSTALAEYRPGLSRSAFPPELAVQLRPKVAASVYLIAVRSQIPSGYGYGPSPLPDCCGGKRTNVD